MVKVRKFTCSECQASYDEGQQLYGYMLKWVKLVIYSCESYRKEFKRKRILIDKERFVKMAKA